MSKINILMGQAIGPIIKAYMHFMNNIWGLFTVIFVSILLLFDYLKFYCGIVLLAVLLGFSMLLSPFYREIILKYIAERIPQIFLPYR